MLHAEGPDQQAEIVKKIDHVKRERKEERKRVRERDIETKREREIERKRQTKRGRERGRERSAMKRIERMPRGGAMRYDRN